MNVVVTVEVELGGHRFKATGDSSEVALRQASFQDAVIRLATAQKKVDAAGRCTKCDEVGVEILSEATKEGRIGGGKCSCGKYDRLRAYFSGTKAS